MSLSGDNAEIMGHVPEHNEIETLALVQAHVPETLALLQVTLGDSAEAQTLTTIPTVQTPGLTLSEAPAQSAIERLILAVREDDIGAAVHCARLAYEKKELNSIVNNTTALHTSLLQGNAALVKLLLQRYEADTTIAVDGWTPLMVATRCRDQTMIKLILDKDRSSLEATNQSGFTALALAIDGGNREAAMQLIQAGSSLKCRTNGGVDLLGLAIKRGRVKLCKLLLQQNDFSLDTAVTHDGWLPLALAVATGKCSVVRHFHRLKPSAINTARHKEWTMLGLAAKYDQLKMVKCLLKLKADTKQLGAYGWSPAMSAAVLGRAKILNFLASRVDVMQIGRQGETMAHLAAMYNRVGIMDIVLTSPQAANLACSRDERGRTPLHVAVTEGHRDLVQQLLQFSPNLAQIKTFANQSPLLLAVELGNTGITECLLAHGAASFDPSVFSFAVSLGDVAIVEKLIQCLQPNDPAAQNVLFNTQCQVAERGDVAMIQVILKQSNVNKREIGTSRRNALMYAAKENQIEMIKCLVEQFGARVDMRSSDGLTALAYSCRHGHLEASKLLHHLGSHLEGGVTSRSNRPLYLAATYHRYPVVTWLVSEGADVECLPRTLVDSSARLSMALQQGLCSRSTSLGLQFLSEPPNASTDALLPRDCWRIVLAYSARTVDWRSELRDDDKGV